MHRFQAIMQHGHAVVGMLVLLLLPPLIVAWRKRADKSAVAAAPIHPCNDASRLLLRSQQGCKETINRALLFTRKEEDMMQSDVTPHTTSVRWGVLSVANIGVKRVIPAI